MYRSGDHGCNHDGGRGGGHGGGSVDSLGGSRIGGWGQCCGASPFLSGSSFFLAGFGSGYGSCSSEKVCML